MSGAWARPISGKLVHICFLLALFWMSFPEIGLARTPEIGQEGLIYIILYESKMNVQSKWIIWNKSKSIFRILKINHNYYQNVTQTFRFSCIYVKISKCSRIRLPQTCIFITTYSYFQIFNVFLVLKILIPWNGYIFPKLICWNQKSS